MAIVRVQIPWDKSTELIRASDAHRFLAIPASIYNTFNV